MDRWCAVNSREKRNYNLSLVAFGGNDKSRTRRRDERCARSCLGCRPTLRFLIVLLHTTGTRTRAAAPCRHVCNGCARQWSDPRALSGHEQRHVRGGPQLACDRTRDGPAQHVRPAAPRHQKLLRADTREVKVTAWIRGRKHGRQLCAVADEGQKQPAPAAGQHEGVRKPPALCRRGRADGGGAGGVFGQEALGDGRRGLSGRHGQPSHQGERIRQGKVLAVVGERSDLIAPESDHRAGGRAGAAARGRARVGGAVVPALTAA